MGHTGSFATTAHLSGDWTIAGVVQQVALLTEFQAAESAPGATVVIDCSGIDEIDLSGFQLIFAWLHCIRIKGLQHELINVPDWMRDGQRRLGITLESEPELTERKCA